jgi:hypothetical protein
MMTSFAGETQGVKMLTQKYVEFGQNRRGDSAEKPEKQSGVS